MSREVIDAASEFFTRGCPGNVLIQRSAVLEILKQLDEHGLQVYGMEGGPLYPDGSYMLKTASCFDKNIMSGDPETARQINKTAVLSVEEDPADWSVYELRVAKV
ncbi:hypothetical protein [Roseibium sp.]|uniref:hypothetical protein n=1 Tax=Roseibium sp. TaxID=1936156 RepID=UPI003D0B2768